MSRTDSISRVVVNAVRSSSPALGSRLGYLLKSTFPDLDLKAEFGSLRQFITVYCKQDIAWHGKRGLDDLYVPLPAPERNLVPPSQTHRVDDLDAGAVSAWDAFVNPTSACLNIDRSDGTLHVCSKTVLLDARWSAILPLQEAEHKMMATQFLGQVDPTEQGKFVDVLSRSPFWPSWYWATKHAFDGKYYRAWVRFRYESIRKLFVDRLRTLQLTRSVEDKALQEFFNSKCARPLRRPDTDAVKHVMTKGAVDLRQAAMSIIKRLSDDELRRLWLPLGLAIDALGGPE